MGHNYRIMNDHYSIVDQYSILNGCLKLISRSKIGMVDRLRIETMLIRMKILLLNDVPPIKIRCGICGEDAFEGLRYQMRRICGGACEENVLTNSMERIGRILTLLGGDPNSEAHSWRRSEPIWRQTDSSTRSLKVPS